MKIIALMPQQIKQYLFSINYLHNIIINLLPPSLQQHFHLVSSIYSNNSLSIIIIKMSKQLNYQQEYKEIKQQYDNLLEKNQNDVIGIKQKEKQLLDEIERLKRQKDSQKVQFQVVIKALREQLQEKGGNDKKQGELTVLVKDDSKLQQKVQQLQMNARKMIDQNIELTANNQSLALDVRELKNINCVLSAQNRQLLEFIKSLQNDLQRLTDQKLNAQNVSTTHDYSSQSQEAWISREQYIELQQKLNKAKKEYDNLKQITSQAKQRIRKSQDETRYMMDRQKKSTNLLKKKQLQVNTLQAQLQKLKVSTKMKKKKTENDESCLKCNDYRREIDLLKGMVKSTQGMVRVREIQVQKYKLHTVDDKESKNNSRYLQKSPSSLPPLKPIKEKK